MGVSIASPRIGVSEVDNVVESLIAGDLADGTRVRTFEAAFADRWGTNHAVATSNGTTALHATLHALGVGPGDRVITTPFSFVATANAIRLCGATPVFADIDPRTLNLDPDSVREVASSCDGSVDAILAVHLFGLPAAMDELRAIADEFDAALVEDAAQAHGARYRDEPVGAVGDVGCFSFYPTKNLTTGEGGMVVTDDDELADAVARFVNHGRTGTYEHTEVGHNFRMTSLAAGIGLAQLERLPHLVDVRRRNAERYDEALADSSAIQAPATDPHTTHAYHQYTVQTDHRDALSERLSDAGVDTGVYYPTPIHQQPAYAGTNASAPVAEAAAERVLSVPVHPKLTAAEVDRVADVLAGFQP